jgi:hypothetical protein
MKKVLFIATFTAFVAATAYSRADLPTVKTTFSKKDDHDSTKKHKKMGKKGGKKGGTKKGGGGGY